MIIKEADSRQEDLNTLEILLNHPQASPEIKKLIDREIKNIRSGIKGEAEAAYEMSVRFKDNKNWFVIHDSDLRIEVDGLIARIDHLIINWFMEMVDILRGSVSDTVRILLSRKNGVKMLFPVLRISRHCVNCPCFC